LLLERKKNSPPVETYTWTDKEERKTSTAEKTKKEKGGQREMTRLAPVHSFSFFSSFLHHTGPQPGRKGKETVPACLPAWMHRSVCLSNSLSTSHHRMFASSQPIERSLSQTLLPNPSADRFFYLFSFSQSPASVPDALNLSSRPVRLFVCLRLTSGSFLLSPLSSRAAIERRRRRRRN